MPYHRDMPDLVFEVVQEADGGYCAECLTENISKPMIDGGPQVTYPMRKPPQCRPRTEIGAETSFIMTNLPVPSFRRYVWIKNGFLLRAAANPVRSLKIRRLRQFASFHAGSFPCGFEKISLCVGK